MNLWVVMVVQPYVSGTDDPHYFAEFVGVYDSVEAAEAAAITPLHMVGPCELNVAAPDERAPWPGAYYPKARA